MIRARLAAIEAAGRRRVLVPLVDPDGVEARVHGRRVVVFCSNDYLGFRWHPQVKQAAAEAIEQFGTGSGSSRLIAGTLRCHEQLEADLARTFGTQAALLFSSGYHANLALLTTLAAEGDLLLSDALNHASIVDGCRLSRARVQLFDHGDAEQLRERIAAPCNGIRWVIAEGLYSMDGDAVDLAAYLDAAQQGGGALIVDEAHSLGTTGPGGLGACAEQGISADVAARMGTLGKSLGSQGAFVLCDDPTRELLVSSGRSLLYTTALPPSSVAAASAALRLMQEEAWRVEQLRDNARRLWQGVRDLGLSTSRAPTVIVPVVAGTEELALAAAEGLLRRGFYARAIRPPTVPPDTCRVRLSVTAQHTADQIDALLAAMKDVMCDLPLRAGSRE